VHHRFLRLLLIPVAVLLVAVLLVAAAELIVRWEPVTAPLPATEGEYVQLLADERLFTLFAALNATGYDDENNEQGMSQVRQHVRAVLASRPLPSLRRLQPYMAMCRSIHPSWCVAWVLQRGPPPDFDRAVEGWWLPKPAFPFLGFDRALASFYQQADIASLWQQHRPAYEGEIERYRAAASPAVDAVLAYLKTPEPPTRGVIVLPNLLDAYWRGYGELVGDVSYVVMGPAVQPNIGLIQHEAMHPIINSMVDAHLDAIGEAQSDRLFAGLKPRLASSGYGTWPSILHECAIRAIEVRLRDPAQHERLIRQEEAQGFTLVRPLAARLEDYEASGRPMAEYMPVLLDALNDETLLQ